MPTEAEWEYACRAGTSTPWSFGRDENQLTAYAWYNVNAWRVGEEYAHPVGIKWPNPWGLYDMHGNVWEFCSDYYGKDFYIQSPPADPTGPPTGTSHVIRGGSWFCNPIQCRSAYRNSFATHRANKGIGFRLALVLAD